MTVSCTFGAFMRERLLRKFSRRIIKEGAITMIELCISGVMSIIITAIVLDGFSIFRKGRHEK